MIDNKIGDFIRQLRKENNMSQEKLASLVPIDRSVVSKWERGEVQPPIDKIINLCNIFNITIDEMLSGERVNENNKKEHQENLSKYLIKQDSKYKRVKKFAVLSSITAFIIIFLFLGYYFYQTYNTEKVYKLYGSSDNYVIKDGVLMLTRENTYLKIGTINDKSDEIALIYRNNNEDIELYKGPSDSLLIDFNGYDGLVNNSNINNIKDNLYVKIAEEEIKLKFIEDYKNDNLILEDKNDLGLDDNTGGLDNSIPLKVKSNFSCDDSICTKEESETKIDYLIEDKSFYIKENDISIQYDISSKIFDYSSSTMSFSIDNGNYICNSKTCKNYKEIYDKYFTNMIMNYLD